MLLRPLPADPASADKEVRRLIFLLSRKLLIERVVSSAISIGQNRALTA